MDSSIAHPPFRTAAFEVSGWRSVASTVCAVLLAVLFLVSGIWKITDPYAAAARMNQALVPLPLSMIAALGVGWMEAVAGIFILVPRYRRWGAWLTGFLLVVFMVYIGVFYDTLRGADCSCFPWLQRLVGPMFFISDGLMLAAAWIAGMWARRSEGLRGAVIIAAAMAVFAGVSYGAATSRLSGIKAPDSIAVEGKQQSLAYGTTFLYFFDPECAHCYQAAKKMGTYKWKHGARVIAVPTSMPQLAPGFLKETGLKASISSDIELLRKIFSVPDGPSAVVLENGRQRERIVDFEGDNPAPVLRAAGFIE